MHCGKAPLCVRIKLTKPHTHPHKRPPATRAPSHPRPPPRVLQCSSVRRTIWWRPPKQGALKSSYKGCTRNPGNAAKWSSPLGGEEAGLKEWEGSGSLMKGVWGRQQAGERALMRGPARPLRQRGTREPAHHSHTLPKVSWKPAALGGSASTGDSLPCASCMLKPTTWAVEGRGRQGAVGTLLGA